MKRIKGTIVHIELEGGFWGIQTDSENYYPLHMHEQIKEEGRIISCSIELVDMMTAQNWGVPCKLLTFTTK